MGSGITLDDFMNGILSGLVVLGVDRITKKNIDRRMEEAYLTLTQQSYGKTDLRFHIESNPLLLDSPSCRIALDRAEDKGILLENRTYWEITTTEEEALTTLELLPLTPPIWKNIACKML